VGHGVSPDGKLLVTEKPGRLRVFENGKLSEPIAACRRSTSRARTGCSTSPSTRTSRATSSSTSPTRAGEQQPAGAKDEGDHRLGKNFKGDDTVLFGGAVARARLDGSKLADLKVIWRQVPRTIGRGHVGARMAFSPDGKLFITSGERQRFEPSQDPNANLGKTIRINPDGSIPDDNPTAKQQGGGRPDVWTTGNRNPLGWRSTRDGQAVGSTRWAPRAATSCC
jgi:glucose/arabinose dehydrogenase